MSAFDCDHTVCIHLIKIAYCILSCRGNQKELLSFWHLYQDWQKHRSIKHDSIRETGICFGGLCILQDSLCSYVICIVSIFVHVYKYTYQLSYSFRSSQIVFNFFGSDYKDFLSKIPQCQFYSWRLNFMRCHLNI